MKKFLVLAGIVASLAACSLKKEVVQIYKGDPGRSCSVENLYGYESQEESAPIGARIFCEDGSESLIYNGQNGANGIDGQDGADAESCRVDRIGFLGVTFLTCPNQWPVAILDGRDGDDGKDGIGCTSERQNQYDRVKITCGSGNDRTVSYVYDGDPGENGRNGKDGKDGKSCTATRVNGGVNVVCGSNAPVFLADGRDGEDGEDGLNGEDAITPGVSCDVYDISSWDNSTRLPELFVGSSLKGNFTLSNFSVPDSPSSNGFPGMPSTLQALVGLEGYALDCAGYLNVPTSGEYTFKFTSDDGAELRINDKTIVGNQGLHAPQTVTKKADLNKGPNRINVVYYQGPHTQIALELKWLGPNLAEQVIPSTKLTH